MKGWTRRRPRPRAPAPSPIPDRKSAHESDRSAVADPAEHSPGFADQRGIREPPPRPPSVRSAAGSGRTPAQPAGLRPVRTHHRRRLPRRDPQSRCRPERLRCSRRLDRTLVRLVLHPPHDRSPRPPRRPRRHEVRQHPPRPGQLDSRLLDLLLGGDALRRGHRHGHHVLRDRRTCRPVHRAPDRAGRDRRSRPERRDLDTLPLRDLRVGPLRRCRHRPRLFLLPQARPPRRPFDAPSAPRFARRRCARRHRRRVRPRRRRLRHRRIARHRRRPAQCRTHPPLRRRAGDRRANRARLPRRPHGDRVSGERRRPGCADPLEHQRPPRDGPRPVGPHHGEHGLPPRRARREHRRLPHPLPGAHPRDLPLRSARRLAQRLDALLLGLVDHLGCFRRHVPRPDLARSDDPPVRHRRPRPALLLRPHVGVDLRQHRARPHPLGRCGIREDRLRDPRGRPLRPPRLPSAGRRLHRPCPLRRSPLLRDEFGLGLPRHGEPVDPGPSRPARRRPLAADLLGGRDRCAHDRDAPRRGHSDPPAGDDRHGAPLLLRPHPHRRVPVEGPPLGGDEGGGADEGAHLGSHRHVGHGRGPGPPLLAGPPFEDLRRGEPGSSEEGPRYAGRPRARRRRRGPAV